jgi:Cu(I)/Ag(I) efflux system protein CusF
MKTMLAISVGMVLLAGGAFASGDHGSPSKAAGLHAQATQGTSPSSATAEGEVRKVDMENRKLTLRHGEIKSLDMPAMTMVFQVKDPSMLEKVKAGDKVRFTAEKLNGVITLTSIEAAK